MRFRLPKPIIILFTLILCCQQAGLAQPDMFNSLRPRPLEERDEEIFPFRDPAVVARARDIIDFLMPILQSGEQTDRYVEALRSGRIVPDVLPILAIMALAVQEHFDATITQVDRVAAVLHEMPEERPGLHSSKEFRVAFEQFGTVCTAMMIRGSLKSLIGGLEGVADSFSNYGEASKQKNIKAGFTTGEKRENFLFRKYKQWIDKEAFGVRELELLINYNLIQPWDCINIQAYVFRHEFRDIIEMARSNVTKAAELLKERLEERVPGTKESVISAVISLSILFHMKESGLERFQIDTLDNALGEWGAAFLPEADLELMVARSIGEAKREAWRIDEGIRNRELNHQRFMAADAAMSFGTVNALEYAINELNRLYHDVYSKPAEPASIRAAILERQIHNLFYEICKRQHDPVRQWPPNVPLTEARRIFRGPDAHLQGLGRIAGEIKHLDGEWHETDTDKMRLWLTRLREVRRWESPSLEGPMLGILNKGIIRMALATHEIGFTKELAGLGQAERAAIFFYIASYTGGYAAFSKNNAGECLNTLIGHTLSRNEDAFAKILEFMNDPKNGFYDDDSPPFKPELTLSGELSSFEGVKITGVKGVLMATPPPVEEIPSRRSRRMPLSSI